MAKKTSDSFLAPDACSSGNAPRGPWRTIATGIQRHRQSGLYRVRWMDRGRQREKNFPRDTPEKWVIEYRDQQLQTAVTTEGVRGRGSFVRDAVRFLKTRRQMPCYKSDKSHMRPWLKLHQGSRQALTPDKIKAAIAQWQSETPPKSAREIRHRLNTLKQFFKFHDGEFERTPVDLVKKPKVPRTEPQLIPGGATLIARVAASLEQQELSGRLRDGKTRARFSVLASCGKRPCQMQRAKPEHVDLSARLWHVTSAKGGPGGVLVLNDEMAAAWKLFIDADAWGDYDNSSFAKTLRRNGFPDGIKPYNLRHETLQHHADQGVDLKLIQQAANHSSPETTMRSYVKHRLQNSKIASEAIEGRFPKTMFRPRKPQKYDKQRDDQIA